MKDLWSRWSKISLVVRILMGVAIGVVLALTIPEYAKPVTLLGDLFVNALKAIAPLLVFILVMSAIANHKSEKETNVKHIIKLYILCTFFAALLAVVASWLFPINLQLVSTGETYTTPSSVTEVLNGLILQIVDNPVKALYNANYIGVLASSITIGIALRGASNTTKQVLQDFEVAISKVVAWIINLAPFGVMGLIFTTITTNGLDAMLAYVRLMVVLVGTEVFFALVINPAIVWYHIRQNPFPLVLKCYRVSGLTAFLTMSSAANIPINLKLCEELGLDKDTYSVSIPLGATVNMAGAAITINLMTLAAAYTLGMDISFTMALLVSIVTAVSAAGSAGVAGGAVILIPVACNVLGIPDDIAMQVVGIGYAIGVVQDSFTTALNSSTDVILTASAELGQRRKNGEIIKF